MNVGDTNYKENRSVESVSKFLRSSTVEERGGRLSSNPEFKILVPTTLRALTCGSTKERSFKSSYK